MLTKQNLTFVSLISFHVLFLLCLVFLGSTVFSLPLASFDHLIQWDALHYLDIRNDGYVYEGCNNPRTAFFPLFPFTWKLLPSGGLAIGLFNFILFSLSLIALAKVFIVRATTVLLYLALPSCFFFFTPYTEAIQFAGITLLLIGIKQDQRLYVFSGTLIATLSRPTFSILLPALFIVTFILIWQKQHHLKPLVIRLIAPMLFAIAIGICLVNGIQYYYTGVWWAMIKAQACWDHGLHAFSFPILSWSADYIHRYDGMIMDIILVISIGIIVSFIRLFFNKKKSSSLINVPFLFSALYLAGIGFSVLLFQKDTHSINRYFICTPFLFIFLAVLLQELKQLTVQQLFFLFVLQLVMGAPFGAFNHIQTLLWYLLSIAIVMNFLLTYYWVNQTMQKISIGISYLVLSGFQAFLLLTFLNGMWVG